MNAMLEPKIVAASTHGLDLSAQGVPGVPDRINASSHGGLILKWMLINSERFVISGA
jgi:hypothetical protein